MTEKSEELLKEEKARITKISNALSFNSQSLKRFKQEGGNEPQFQKWGASE